jgi:hypothetical protein
MFYVPLIGAVVGVSIMLVFVAVILNIVEKEGKSIHG